MFDPPVVIEPENDEQGWVTDTRASSGRWLFQSRVLQGESRGSVTGEFFRTLFGGFKSQADGGDRLLRNAVARIVGLPGGRSGVRVCIIAGAVYEDVAVAWQRLRSFFKSTRPAAPADPDWPAFVAAVREAAGRVDKTAATSSADGHPAFELVSDRPDSAEQIGRLLATDAGLARLHDSKGRTLLHRAVFHCNRPLIAVLLRYNADVNAVDAERSTPLHLARCLTVVQDLVAAGAALNAQNDAGNTPVHSLVRSGRLSKRKKQDILVWYRAQPSLDLSLTNHKGVTVQSLVASASSSSPSSSSSSRAHSSKSASLTGDLAAMQSRYTAAAEDLRRQAAELTARENEVRRLTNELQSLRDRHVEVTQQNRALAAERDRLVQKQAIHDLTASTTPRDEAVAKLVQLNQALSEDLTLRDDRLVELLEQLDSVSTERDSLVDVVRELSDKSALADELVQSLRSQVADVTNENLTLSEHLGDALLAAQTARTRIAAYEDQIRQLSLRSSQSLPAADSGAVASTSSSAGDDALSVQLTGAVESLASLTSMQSLLDQFLQQWQPPVGTGEICVQALAVSRLFCLLRSVCESVSLDKLYALLDKYTAVLDKKKQQQTDTLFGLNPRSVLELVVGTIRDTVFHLQTAYLQGLDRNGLLGLRAYWFDNNVRYAVDTFLPLVERQFLTQLVHDLRRAEPALVAAGKDRFLEFLAAEQKTVDDPLLSIVQTLIDHRLAEFAAPAPPVQPPPAAPATPPPAPVLPPPAPPVPKTPAKTTTTTTTTPSTSSGDGRSALLSDISSFRFPGREALRASIGAQKNVHRHAQIQMPVKVRILPMHTVVELIDREAKMRMFLGSLGEKDDDDDDDDDDWSDDDDDDDDDNVSLVQAWKKLMSQPPLSFGAFDPNHFDVRETFVPLEVASQSFDSDDAVKGFVLLKPLANEPAVIDIVFFGLLADQVMHDTLAHTVQQCANITQLRLADARQLAPTAASFEMKLRVQAQPDSPLHAFFARAGFAAAQGSLLLEKTHDMPVAKLTGTAQMQYAFALKNRTN